MWLILWPFVESSRKQNFDILSDTLFTSAKSFVPLELKLSYFCISPWFVSNSKACIFTVEKI